MDSKTKKRVVKGVWWGLIILLPVLRLFGVIDWHWEYVLIPVWVWVAVVLLLVVSTAILGKLRREEEERRRLREQKAFLKEALEKMKQSGSRNEPGTQSNQ